MSSKKKRTLRDIHLTKLRKWRIGSENQERWNQPPDFVSEFPQAATEEYLRKHVWWWRYMESQEEARRVFVPWADGGFGDINAIMYRHFADYLEPSAWFYEFRARHAGRYRWDFGFPWLKCSQEERRTLTCLVPGEHPARLKLPLTTDKDFWVSLSIDANLLLNDETLAHDYLAVIAKQRELHGVKRPGIGQGVRRRALSWAAIEAMDIRHYKIRALEDGERSSLRNGRKRYFSICDELGLDR